MSDQEVRSRVWRGQPSFDYVDHGSGLRVTLDDAWEKVAAIGKAVEDAKVALNNLQQAALAIEAAHRTHRKAVTDVKAAVERLSNVVGRDVLRE